MAQLQKNVASQHWKFGMVTTAGAADASATVTAYITKDGGAQASAGGTVTNLGNGQYDYAPTQAETNADDIGFLATATGDVPAHLDFHTVPPYQNGYEPVDLESIVAVNVSTTTAQLGVNVVKYNNQTAATDGNNLPKVDAEDWKGNALLATITNGVPVVDWIPSGWRQNTAQAGANGSITLDASASSTNNFYKYSLIMLIAGTGAGQARLCTGYTGSTQVATVAPNWTTNPDSTSKFVVMPLGITDVEAWLETAVTAATAGIPDVNTKNYNNQTAQTDGSNLPKVDVVNIAGTASAGAAGYVGVDWANITNPTATVGLSGTTVGIVTALTSTERNAMADAWAARNIAGGSSSGRTNAQAIQTLRNKQAIVSGTYTCYETDDATPLFEANVTTTAGNPMSAWAPTS